MSAVNKHRAMAKAKITRVKTFIDEYPLDSEQPVQQYEARLTMLDAAFTSFTDYHNKVVAEAGTVTDQDQEDYFIPVEQVYLETKSTLHLIIQTRQSLAMVQPVPNKFNPNHLIPKSEIRLPRLSLPSFSGDYSEWTTFFDLFKCTVDQNMTLTNAQRLQYLKSVLKGEALNLIQHFSITNDNYVDAWKKLQQRYNKKKNIIYNFINKFNELPNVTQVTAEKLRHLTSTSDVILRSISSLGYESRDPWIIYMILEKLDPETQSLWSLETSGNDEPTQKELFQFLNKRCDALESCPDRTTVNSITNDDTELPDSDSSHSLYQSSTYRCTACFHEQHHLYECARFRGWDVSERINFVNQNQHCYNCLNPFHSVASCDSKYSCNECRENHHTLLHVDSSNQSTTSLDTCPQTTQQPMNSEIYSPTTSTESDMCSYHITLDKIGILPTAMVYTKDIRGNLHEIRVLLDSASDSSLITEACMKRLHLKPTKVKRSLTGVTGIQAQAIRGITKVTIFSRINRNSVYDLETYVVTKITEYIPPENLLLSDWDLIKSVRLADPGFAKHGQIDMIIGTELFMSLIRPGQIDSKDGRPIITNTVFGWVFSGKMNNKINKPLQTLHFNVHQNFRKLNDAEENEVPIQLTEVENSIEYQFKTRLKPTEDVLKTTSQHLQVLLVNGKTHSFCTQ